MDKKRLPKMDLFVWSIKNLDEKSPKCDIDIKAFCDSITHLSSKYGLKQMHTFVDSIKKLKKNELFRKDIYSKQFGLVDKIENLFFKVLLGGINENINLCRYTNLKSITYLSNNSQGMTSLVGMNDSTESLYTYDYLTEKGFLTSVGKYELIHFGSKAFITSFTTRKDDLTMWRLYGDDGKGVAYEYKPIVNELANGFYLAPVSYANEAGNHNELNFILEINNLVINDCNFRFQNLLLWSYFFKPYEYKIEDEIRLLYFPTTNQGISDWVETSIGVIAPIRKFYIQDKNIDMSENKVEVYPLDLLRIWLGPKIPHARSNKENIKQMIKEKFGWDENDVQIEISHIKNYR